MAQSVERWRSNPKVVGSIPTLVRVFLCPCVGPFPSVGLTLTWFIWDRNLALHITLYSVNSTLIYSLKSDIKCTWLRDYGVWIENSVIFDAWQKYVLLRVRMTAPLNFYSPLDGRLVQRRTTSVRRYLFIHLGGERHREIKRLAQEHNTMSPARARTESSALTMRPPRLPQELWYGWTKFCENKNWSV